MLAIQGMFYDITLSATDTPPALVAAVAPTVVTSVVLSLEITSAIAAIARTSIQCNSL